MAKTNSGLLEFKDAQKVLIALDDATSEVKKAVVIDGDGVETDIAGVQPTGKKEITSTEEVNVANYATAQVVDEDLVAGNIKKDVDILGVVGSYEGGGSSDFSTTEVTISKGTMGTQVDGIIPWFSEEDNQTYSTVELVDEETLTVKVPVGGNSITVYFSRSAQSTNGDIESGGDVSFMSKNLKSYLITGDCTISFT